MDEKKSLNKSYGRLGSVKTVAFSSATDHPEGSLLGSADNVANKVFAQYGSTSCCASGSGECFSSYLSVLFCC